MTNDMSSIESRIRVGRSLRPIRGEKNRVLDPTGRRGGAQSRVTPPARGYIPPPRPGRRPTNLRRRVLLNSRTGYALLKPVREPRRAEPRGAGGGEALVVQLGAEVPGLGVRNHGPRVARRP